MQLLRDLSHFHVLAIIDRVSGVKCNGDTWFTLLGIKHPYEMHILFGINDNYRIYWVQASGLKREVYIAIKKMSKIA